MAFSLFRKKNYADSIFRGGIILSLDPEYEGATAIAVKDGEIMAIGSDEDIAALEGPSTKVEELGGAYLCPGIIDPFTTLADDVLDELYIKFNSDDTIFTINSAIRDRLIESPDSDYLLCFGIGRRFFDSDEESTDSSNFSTMLEDLETEIPVLLISEDGLSMRLSKSAQEMVSAAAEEIGVQTVTPEFVFDNLIALDFEKCGRKHFIRAEDYASHGVTSVFSASGSLYLDKAYRDLLTEIYGADLIKQRYFGCLPIKRAINPRSLMYTLNTHSTLCLELDELINFNDLVLTASSGGTELSFMSPDYLESVCRAAADKGFNIRVNALDKEMAVTAYDTLGNLSTSYPRQSFVIIYNGKLSESELSRIFTGNAIFISPEDGNFAFRGAALDALAYYTEGAARILGEEGILGSLEEGLAADFAVFRTDPRNIAEVADLFKLEAEMTVIDGEVVYRRGIDNAENWTQLMLSQLESINEGMEEEDE